MQHNQEFVSAVAGAITDKGAPLLFICRSGARSAAAAKAMTAAGYSTCLNVAEGFGGPLDAQAKRGSAGGWEGAGPPLRQKGTKTYFPRRVTTQRTGKKRRQGPRRANGARNDTRGP